MIIHDANTTAKQLCEDLDKIKEWSLNPDQSKQEQEVIFTCNISCTCTYFNL